MIKDGPYGKYYEFKDSDDKIYRFSLEKSCGHYTEEMCKDLAAGKTVKFEGKNQKKAIRAEGYAKLATQNRPGGKSFIYIKETITNTVKDRDLAAEIARSNIITSDATDINAAKDIITDAIKAADMANPFWKVYDKSCGDVSDETELRVIYIKINEGIYLDMDHRNSSTDIVYLLVRKCDKSIIDVIYEDELQSCKAKIADHDNEIFERRKREEEARRLKMEQDRIDAIKAEPWKRETLLSANMTESAREYAAEFLRKNYPGRDPDEIVLYLHKTVRSSSDRPNSIYGSHTHKEYIASVLPGLDIEKILESNFFLTQVSVKKVSVEWDDQITHSVTRTTYND